MENYLENNKVLIGGEIISEAEFSHEIYGEKFLKFTVKTKRLSNQEDIIPVIISERMVKKEEIELGRYVKISGQFRSYNMQTETKNKLVLSVFVKQIEFTEDEKVLSLNEASFEGYICKTPIYRKTPLGREIADVLIAVNRTYKKSDYIPCILWGRNAKYCENLEIGTKVKIEGRIQSRKYEKKIEDSKVIKKTAYEVSVSKFTTIE